MDINNDSEMSVEQAQEIEAVEEQVAQIEEGTAPVVERSYEDNVLDALKDNESVMKVIKDSKTVIVNTALVVPHQVENLENKMREIGYKVIRHWGHPNTHLNENKGDN